MVLTTLKQLKGKQKVEMYVKTVGTVTLQHADIRYSLLPSPAFSEALCGPKVLLKTTVSAEVW